MVQRSNQQGSGRSSGQQQGSQSAPRQPQQSQSGSRQQQQFEDRQRQPGGSGSDSRFADQIRQHQEVVDQSGALVGTVDHVDGDRIKLTRSSSGDGQHHYIPLTQVAGIEGDKIRLSDRGDASFGQPAGN